VAGEGVVGVVSSSHWLSVWRTGKYSSSDTGPQPEAEPGDQRTRTGPGRVEPVHDRNRPVHDWSRPVHDRNRPVHDRNRPVLERA